MTLDNSDLKAFMTRAVVTSRLQLPFYESPVRAGFPAPSESYVEKVCDLNDLCITNREATYFVRAEGDSMEGDSIQEGDVLIVDCSREPLDGKIVVAWAEGGNTVKRIHYAGSLIVLMPSNPKYEPIYIQPGDNFRLYGVVTFVVHKCR